MTKCIVETEKAPAAIGTYSQGVELNGTFYFSGQIGLDPLTMKMEADCKSQLEQVLRNIDGLLESQSLKRVNILKTSVFITNLNNFHVVNKAYQDYFSAPYPARTCVEVQALPKGALIEIEVIASR